MRTILVLSPLHAALVLNLPIPLNTPMGDELKWFLKRGGWVYFESCDSSLKYTPTSQAVSLALVMYACSDSAKPLFVMRLLMVSAFIC